MLGATRAVVIQARNVDAKNPRSRSAIERKLTRYPTDLTDDEWNYIRDLLPPVARRGRQRKVDLREALNTIRYLVRTGCGWRMLPRDFSPWQTVYW